MRRNTVAVMICVLAVVLVGATGCVSKGMFKKSNEDTDVRVQAVESGIEANERRIADLKGETDSKLSSLEGETDRALETSSRALQAASAAERAAQGKLVWSVTLSDDSVRFGSAQSTLSAFSRSNHRISSCSWGCGRPA